MPDSALDILKLVLLVLLYLFFARVLWAVWSEVRQPEASRGHIEFTPSPPAPANGGALAERRDVKPVRGRRGSAPARLVVIEPKERRNTAYAIDGTVTIGREPDNTIVLAHDTYLSGHHASITRTEGGVMAVDLGSRNGTFLNGMRLAEPRPMKTGDRLQIGYTVFEAQ
jgi:hypothetical protein